MTLPTPRVPSTRWTCGPASRGRVETRPSARMRTISKPASLSSRSIVRGAKNSRCAGGRHQVPALQVARGERALHVARGQREQAARPRHPRHLVQHRARIGEVLDDVPQGDDVELPVDERRVEDLAGEDAMPELLARMLGGERRHLDARDLVVRGGGMQEVAGRAPEVQQPAVRDERGQSRRARPAAGEPRVALAEVVVEHLALVVVPAVDPIERRAIDARVHVHEPARGATGHGPAVLPEQAVAARLPADGAADARLGVSRRCRHRGRAR